MGSTVECLRVLRPFPNLLARLLNRSHRKIYAPLSVLLVGNSFVSPTLSPKHPATLSSPKTRSPEARGRLVAGVFDAAIAAAAAVGVLFAAAAAACGTALARAYCLLLDLEGSIGRAQHTHTHTHIHIERGG